MRIVLGRNRLKSGDFPVQSCKTPKPTITVASAVPPNSESYCVRKASTPITRQCIGSCDASRETPEEQYVDRQVSVIGGAA